MSSDPFFSFLALVTQDAAILNDQKKIDALTHTRQGVVAGLKQLQELLHTAQREALSAKKNFDIQELEIKVLRERQRALTNKLALAGSPKEYFSLETELKSIATDIDTQENKLFELFDAHEIAEKKAGELDLQVVEAEAQTRQQVAEIDQQKAETEKSLKEHKEIYDELLPNVNPEMLEKFLSMKTSIENPVVPVEKNSCSVCGNMLVSQEMVSIRKHKLIPCQNCFRLLYAEAPTGGTVI